MSKKITQSEITKIKEDACTELWSQFRSEGILTPGYRNGLLSKQHKDLMKKYVKSIAKKYKLKPQTLIMILNLDE